MPDSIRVFDIGKGHLNATGLMSASDQQRMLLHYRLTKRLAAVGWVMFIRRRIRDLVAPLP